MKPKRFQNNADNLILILGKKTQNPTQKQNNKTNKQKSYEKSLMLPQVWEMMLE